MGNCQQIQNLQENELKTTQKETGIYIAVKIWSKKSNELFNYEARTYKELKYDLLKQETLPKQLRHLFWRNQDDGLMLFNPNKNISVSNDKQERSFLSKWVNLSSLDRQNGIEIQVNDVYKFGNTLLKVKDIYFSNHQQKFRNSFDAGSNYNCGCNSKKNTLIIGNCSDQQQQYSKLLSDKSCQKQLSQISNNNNGKCQRCQNGCQGNNWTVMQKATTMMLSSKYQGTEECNDDLDQSYFDNNCENQVAVNTEKQACNQNCCNNAKRSKKSLCHNQGEPLRQCKICLQTEDEEKLNDSFSQSLQKQNDELENKDHSFTLHQSNIKEHQNCHNHSFYSTQYTFNNNPLISICGCQGSMKYVHLKCLQTWVKSKQLLNDSFSSKYCEYYSHKAMICELCKKNYPLKININGKKVFLLQMEEQNEEEGTKIIYPASTGSRQDSNVNQAVISMRQNSQENILQIDNEDDDNIADQDESPFEGHDNNENESIQSSEDEGDDQNSQNSEGDEEEQNEDQEEEEQKTDWENLTNQKKREKKKKTKRFDNYVIFEISNSQNTSLNGLIILNLQKTYENKANLNKTYSSDQNKNSSVLKTIFTLGRQNSCDIKINDITVSRFHAELKVNYEKGRIFLKDTNSKFGTLIKLRKELVINKKLDGVQIQINNVCLEFCIGQDPQQEFYNQQYTNKQGKEKDSRATICQFSTCFKTNNTSKPDYEINIQDASFKFRDQEYSPIEQLHDLNPLELSYQN
ncbi:FHA domain protein (macronuclear) [Tetrahymena thermophila SB210]|uniref:FHA domain protein n=1 Tax=Tetrahymena thermophila (strain SB210) TaxID=312017 RepID=Q238T9_TETTS|nr:FHA domain protein [Tetrahymena thermophila SB210]EAR93131.1 FHA domain protein [Tetrahymena thermophila SB210]|eukprot:XP_001013376.1 FHA domain protein [Tetrahymena thermophila SB210]